MILYHAVKIFLLSLVCVSFQFIPHSSVALPSIFLTFLVVYIYFLCSSILLIISCVIHDSLAFLQTFPTNSLIISTTHVLLLFSYNELFFNSILHILSLSIHLLQIPSCLSLWNLLIFFNPGQIYVTGKLWQESGSALDSVWTSFILFHCTLIKLSLSTISCLHTEDRKTCDSCNE
jgi:hypothetical protein